jgi:hypothetical protein
MAGKGMAEGSNTAGRSMDNSTQPAPGQHVHRWYIHESCAEKETPPFYWRRLRYRGSCGVSN